MVKNSEKEFKMRVASKSAWTLLALSLSIVLGSGCAVAMGHRRSCDAPELPTRPEYEQCVFNGSGTVACFDPRRTPHQYVRPINNDDVITNIVDFNGQDTWVSDVLRACR